MTFPRFKSSKDFWCKETTPPHYLTYWATYELLSMYPAFLPTLLHSSFVDFPSLPWTLQGFPIIGALEQLSLSPMMLFPPDIYMFSISDLNLHFKSKEEVFPDSAPSDHLFYFSWITCHW